MSDWRDELLPEKEIIDNISNILMVSSQGELELIIQICMGVKAWAFDPRFMRESSAVFVYSSFGITEYQPHNFFRYYMDQFSIKNFTVIEHTGINPRIDRSTFTDIRNTMCAIFPHLTDVSMIPDGLIKTVLREFTSYLHDDPEIYGGKSASRIYRAIDYAKESKMGACVRMLKSTTVEYEYFEEVSVEPVYSHECQYCGNTVACIQSTSTATCESCLAKRDKDENNATCDHVECGNYSCIHYRGNEEFPDDYCAER